MERKWMWHILTPSTLLTRYCYFWSEHLWLFILSVTITPLPKIFVAFHHQKSQILKYTKNWICFLNSEQKELRYYHKICLKILRKTMKNPSQDKLPQSQQLWGHNVDIHATETSVSGWSETKHLRTCCIIIRTETETLKMKE